MKNEQRIRDGLVERVRHLGTSAKMVAILGYLLNERITYPQIEEILVTVDGWVMARHEGDVGANHMIGRYSDLERNVRGAVTAMDLTPPQRAYLLRALEVRVPQQARQYVS